MNRRTFFSAVLGALGSMVALPAFLMVRESNASLTEATLADFEEGFCDRAALLEACGLPTVEAEDYWSHDTLPPVVYTGDKSDQSYHICSDGRAEAREGMRLFVNGIDRTDEAYECYVGEKGWANLYVRVPGEKGALRSVFVGGRQGQMGLRGKVEFKKPLHVALSELVMSGKKH